MVQGEPNFIPEQNPPINFDQFLSDIIRDRRERNFLNEKKINREKEHFIDKISFPNKDSKLDDKKINITDPEFFLNKDPESEIINDHLDQFINNTLTDTSNRNDEFRRVLDRLSRDPSANIPFVPAATRKDERKAFHSKHGLMAQDWAVLTESELTVDGQKVIEEGARFTRVDFTPGGRVAMVPAKMTDSIANGIKGLTELVAAIDAGLLELEPVFIGTTNVNMALISQRLGFRIVDADRRPDGSVDKTKAKFRVVGRLEDIRKKLSEFAQSGIQERVLERDLRLKMGSQTI